MRKLGELGSLLRFEGLSGFDMDKPCADFLVICAERYFEALKDSRIRGYLFEQQNYLPGDEPGSS